MAERRYTRQTSKDRGDEDKEIADKIGETEEVVKEQEVVESEDVVVGKKVEKEKTAESKSEMSLIQLYNLINNKFDKQEQESLEMRKEINYKFEQQNNIVGEKLEQVSIILAERITSIESSMRLCVVEIENIREECVEIRQDIGNREKIIRDLIEKKNNDRIEQIKQDLEVKIRGELEDKISKVEEKILKIQEDRERLNENVIMNDVRGSYYINPGTIEKESPKFSKNKNKHPKEFIKELEQYLWQNKNQLGNRYNLVLEMSVIKASMCGEAGEWYKVKEGDFKSFKEFEKGFLKTFWGIKEQEKMRIELYQERYNPKDNCTREQYVLKRIHLLRYLDGINDDRTIIGILAGHFEVDISQKIDVDDIEQLDQFIKIVKAYDSGDERRNKEKGDENNGERYHRENNQNRGYYRSGNNQGWRGNSENRYHQYRGYSNNGNGQYRWNNNNGNQQFRGENYNQIVNAQNRNVQYRNMPEFIKRQERENVVKAEQEGMNVERREAAPVAPQVFRD